MKISELDLAIYFPGNTMQLPFILLLSVCQHGTDSFSHSVSNRESENESVTALLIFFYICCGTYRINTDVVMTHDFPLSQYEEVSYIQDEQQTFQTKEINISDYSIQYSSLFN